jgi:4-hydroxy 2-oxovalerate aldolase
MKRLTLVDVTLRDGSHAKSHQISAEEVRSVVRALDAAGVPVIEVSHGDGLGGSSFNYGRSLVDEFDLISVAVSEAKSAKIAVLLIPGIGVKEDVAKARDLGATVARIATHCTEADISPQHIALSRELGMTTVGFLMMAHMSSPQGLAEQARIMADAGAQIVYVTDSAGALLPEEAKARVAALRAALPADVEVGLHAHHNLSLSVANSLTAIEAGATWIDAATCGLGAGAGNTPHEVLVAVLDKLGIETGVDTFALMDAAEEIIRPVTPGPQIIDRSSLLLGYAGVYSSFLLHAEKAAKRFDVSAKDILVELGRRKTVGGQEDLVFQVAAELALAGQ